MWNDILAEKHMADPRLDNHHTIEGKPSFLISYWQGMGSRAFQVMHGRLYSIRKGLTLTRKKEVALRIFMEVSLGFEAMQGSWPYSWVTDSGFSAEDLTSNLIGFYRAVEKYSWEQILQACRPTSKETAFAVYDANFTKGIGGRKVTEFFKPLRLPCDECSGDNAFPAILSRIKPAGLHQGDFVRFDSASLSWRHWVLGEAADFDRFGKPKSYR